MSQKDVIMLQEMMPFVKMANPSTTKYTDIVHSDGTKKTSIKFLLLPEWSNMFPPFNMARLSSVVKQSGYKSSCLDLNVKIYNEFRKFIKDGLIDYDPWTGTRTYKWAVDEYESELKPLIIPILEKYAKQIVKDNPTVVGFTLYYGNIKPSIWLAKRIKELNKDIILIAGGPASHTESENFSNSDLFSYFVIGEGEQIILEILDNIENGKTFENVQVLTQAENQRINLNQFEIPDYSSFNFNEYGVPNGILTELSRGCIAKCTFCSETHFWKYRQRDSKTAIDEIKFLNKKYGTDLVWFLDSLVNGNLSELKNFCNGVINSDLSIKWTGYSRCDGRMNKEYYQMLYDSGCFMLNYGCESGSNKVLKDMDKRVTTSEMEQNLKDGSDVGVQAMTNWIVGFPTEEPNDFAHTLTFLWRNRNYLKVILSASAYGLNSPTIVGQNLDRFGVSYYQYLGQWMRSDFTLTKLHLLFRSKSFSIFTQQLLTKFPINVSPRENLKKYHYKISYNNPKLIKQVDYEDFDYKIVNPKLNPLADSLINEMFPLFRLLWRCRGGYEIEVLFNEEIDMMEYGDFLASPIDGKYKFKISDVGDWECNIDLKFRQPDDNVYKIIDNRQITSATIYRARQLSKSKYGITGIPDEKWNDILEEKNKLKKINQSFNFNRKIEGTWKQKKSLL